MKVSMLTSFINKYLKFFTRPHTPLFANIDLTMKCNSRCKFCTRWTDNYELGSYSKEKCRELKTKEVFTVVDNVAKFPVLNVTFQGAEVLLREDLPKILEYSKERGLYTHIITNGLLLEKRAEEIAPFIDWILVSYDTPIKKDYKYLRGVDALQIVERGIKKIVELSKIHKFLVITNTVLTNINANYIDKVVKRGFEYLKVHGMSFEELLTFDDIRCTWRDLKIKLENQFDSVVSKLKEFKKTYPIMNSNFYLNHLIKRSPYLCKPYLFLMVNADGKVNIPCVGFPRKTLDFTKQNVYKDWYSDENIWNINCNICTMQCIIEVSKMFPIPPISMFIDWVNGISRAKSRMEHMSLQSTQIRSY